MPNDAETGGRLVREYGKEFEFSKGVVFPRPRFSESTETGTTILNRKKAFEIVLISQGGLSRN